MINKYRRFFPNIKNTISTPLFGHKVWEEQVNKFENAYTITYESFKSHKYYLNSDVRKEKITELKDIELVENLNIKKKFVKEIDGQKSFKEALKEEKKNVKFNTLEKFYFWLRRKIESRKRSRKNY